jgi:hypothetical protein
MKKNNQGKANSTSQTNTKILTFSSKRGRPRSNRPQIDTGTPETVMKRLLGVTTEALDLCLQHGIITEKQHWCGIHLRWLYTLRHGIPSIRANDLSYIGGVGARSSEYDSPDWRAAREKEYSVAVNSLTQGGCAILIMNLCIYNELPKSFSFFGKNNAKDSAETAISIRKGLDILKTLWKSGVNTNK